jgi:hypothetical protein
VSISYTHPAKLRRPSSIVSPLLRPSPVAFLHDIRFQMAQLSTSKEEQYTVETPSTSSTHGTLPKTKLDQDENSWLSLLRACFGYGKADSSNPLSFGSVGDSRPIDYDNISSQRNGTSPCLYLLSLSAILIRYRGTRVFLYMRSSLPRRIFATLAPTARNA